MASPRTLSFGALLKRYRLAAGLTQEGLAEKAGLSVRGISAIERGISQIPHKDTRALLADALALAPHERALFESAAQQRRAIQSPQLPRPSHTYRLSSGASSLFVGRVAELALLDRLLSDDGPPVLMLAGEPGIGKSRLLRELGERATDQGWAVLVGGCHRRSGHEPYAPFPGMLAQTLAQRSRAQQRLDLQGCAWLTPLLPELADSAVLPTPAPTWSLPTAQEQRLMFAAVARLLMNLAGPAGTLLLLDDLHWADTDTLDLLATLVRSPTERPLRVIGAYRDTDITAKDALALLLADLAREGIATRAPLAPLAADEATTLLDALLRDLPESGAAQREQVLQRAGGVPFFLVSCAQELRVSALSDSIQQEGGSALPWSVAESIRQRVAALPEAARYALGAAAVAGRRIARNELIAVATQLDASEERILTALDAACQARLLAETENDSYTFTHDLIREVVAADLGSARRSVLHRRLAEALERLPSGAREQRVAELAWHFAQSDRSERALPYAIQAGDRAEQVFAHSEAEQHYRVAVPLAHQLGNLRCEAETLEKIGMLLDTTGRFEEAATALKQAVALYQTLGDRDQVAISTHRLARAHNRAGNLQAGVATLQSFILYLTADGNADPADRHLDLAGPRALAALAAISPAPAARVGLSIANHLRNLGRPQDALTLFQHVLTLARLANDPQIIGHALYMQGFVWRALDRIDEIETAWREALPFSESAADFGILAVTLSQLAPIVFARGEFAETEQILARGLDLAEQIGDPRYMTQCLVVRSHIAYTLGNWRQARSNLERAQAITRQDAPLVSAELARLDIAEGWSERGAAALAEALTYPPRSLGDMGDMMGDVGDSLHTFAQTALIETALLAGRMSDVRIRADSIADTVQPPYPMSSTILAWALIALGEEDHAEQLLSNILEQTLLYRQRVLRADALRIQALLAIHNNQWAVATAALDEALTLARAIPYPYAEAKALYVAAQLRTARGEPAQAREHLTSALAILNQLGEQLYAQHIEATVGIEPPLTPPHD